MENRKFVGIIIALGVLMSTPSVAYGYAVSTHASLTEKTFAEYERVFGDTFTDEEIERAKQGSMDEDTFESTRRPLNHFYDPVNDVGLRAHGMLSIPNITRGLAAPVWAVDTEAQANFLKERIGYNDPLFSSPTDFSWDRAVYEYVHGDKERAVKTLGHIIHLVQDATSPAHVRNDPHLMGDVYETFTNGMQPEDWYFEEKDISQDNSIQSIIERTALFTNRNFLSGDTIFKEYNKPSEQGIGKWESIKFGEEVRLFGYSKHGALVSLVSDYNFLGKKIDETYTLLDPHNIVLTDYWETLSKRAVQDGVAAIRLFFEAVEKERETLALQDKNKSAAEKNFGSAQATLFGIAKGLYGSSVDRETFNELNPDAAQQGAAVLSAEKDGNDDTEVVEEPTHPQELPEENGGNQEENTPFQEQPITERTEEVDQATENEEENTENTNSETTGPPDPFAEDIPIQGVGGGGAPASNEASENKEPDESEDVSESEEQNESVEEEKADESEESKKDQEEETEQDQKEDKEDTTPPDAPIVTTPSDTTHVFTNSRVTFSGTAEATSTIHTDFSNATTSVDQNGEWSLSLDLPQGTSTTQFFATDQNGNTSTATPMTLFIDSEITAPTLSIAECADSLSESGCLVATTTLSVQWSLSDEDVDHFIVAQDGNIATTTATSTLINTDDPDDIVISVRAIDTAGNTSERTTKEISVRNNPVVINEVAWMGTRASAFDEWIELYNPTDTDISLEKWTLHAGDGSPYIPLSGTIDAGGYYIIERSDDNTLASTTADLAVPFSGLDESAGLSNRGQHLVLSRYNDNANATTTIDRTPNCSNWCGGGSKDTYRTMERYDVNASGEDRNNWGTALSAFIRNGTDADGSDINGTPGERNSISYQIANSSTLEEDKTLTAKHPYIIGRDGIVIDQGVTLTIEEGVVVKFVSANEPSLTVNGTLKTYGTEAEPVVFTAFKDDTYGGDMNGDEDATSPAPGSWKKILFTDTSEQSMLTHTIIRYGGRWFSSTDMKAAVAVDNTNVSFDQVTVSYPARHGLYLRTSTSTVTNSAFKFATSTSDAAGVYVAGGAPEVSNSVFKKNQYGAYIADAPETKVENSTFVDNKTIAVHVRGPVPRMVGNGGSGNTLNAITIGHNKEISEPNSTTTLRVNTLPYLVVGEGEVPADATLTFESGVVVKAHDDNKNNLGGITVADEGRMVYDGTDPTDVVFTSMHDDTIGGKVDGGDKSPAPGDWAGIVVENGGHLSLEGFTLRYAGQERGRSQADGLRIESENGTTTIAHAVIERNKQFGVLAREDVVLDISDTEIKNHSEDSDVAHNRIGLLLLGSDAVLSETSFSNNETDIEVAKGANVECDTCGTLDTKPPDLFE